MRLLAFILAIVVVMLSIMPCADTYAMSHTQNRNGIGQEVPQHEHQEDLCSPFCHCSCCSTHVIAPQQLTTIIISPDYSIKRVYSQFIPQAVIAVFLPIWQPPKL